MRRIVIPVDDDGFFRREGIGGFLAQNHGRNGGSPREKHDRAEQEIPERKTAREKQKIFDSNLDHKFRGEGDRKINGIAVALQGIDKNFGTFNTSGQLQREFKEEQEGVGA